MCAVCGNEKNSELFSALINICAGYKVPILILYHLNINEDKTMYNIPRNYTYYIQ